jgi:hypothetical protein
MKPLQEICLHAQNDAQAELNERTDQFAAIGRDCVRGKDHGR